MHRLQQFFSRSEKQEPTPVPIPIPLNPSGAAKGPEVDFLVLVLGLCGDGKSTFINASTGDQNAKTSSALDTLKGTNAVQKICREYNGRKVTFIDTPGLDNQPDTLGSVVTQAFSIFPLYDRKHADAIVYVHAAARNRVTKPKTPEIVKKFELLCGSSWKSRVIFAVNPGTLEGKQKSVDVVKLKGFLEKIFYPEVEPIVFSPSSTADVWKIIDKSVKSDPPT